MNKVRRLRTKLNLTQSALAKKVGTSQQQIQRIEGGQEPRLELALAICEALDVSLPQVFPSLRAVSAKLSKRGEAPNYNVWHDEEALRELEKAGIDTDPALNLVKVRLASGVERVYHVTGPEKNRMWDAFQGRHRPGGDDAFNFVVFDSDTHRVAVNAEEVAYVHFLFEAPIVRFERKEPGPGIQIFFSRASEPHHVGMDPDPPPPDPEGEDDEGAVRQMFSLLDLGMPDGEVIILNDVDGEPIFLNPRHVALIEANLNLVLEDDLSGDDEEAGRTDAPPERTRGATEKSDDES